jgi:yecA family protein
MKRLPINFQDLQQALEDCEKSIGAACWFDTETGAVSFLSITAVEEEAFPDTIEQSGSRRFVPIDRLASHDSYEIMADFVGILPQSEVRERLERALGDAKPSQQFGEVLLAEEQVRKQWFKFHDEAIRLYAIEWLSNLGIRPIGEEELPDRNTGVEKIAGLENESWSQNEDGTENSEDRAYLYEDLSMEEEAEMATLVDQISGSRYDLSKLHGLLTAWIVGPIPVNPADVLSVIAGKGNPIAENIERVQYFLDLLGRFHGEIVSDLEAEAFEPIVYRDGQPPEAALVNLSSWGKGFVEGIEQTASAWEKWFADPRREKAIGVIFGVAGLESNQSSGTPEREQIELTAYELVCTWVPLIRHYWHFESSLQSLVGSPGPAGTEGR